MLIFKRALKIVISLLCIGLIVYTVMHLTPELAIRASVFKSTVFAGTPQYHPLVAFDSKLELDKKTGTTLYRLTKHGNVGFTDYSVSKVGFLYFAKSVYYG